MSFLEHTLSARNINGEGEVYKLPCTRRVEVVKEIGTETEEKGSENTTVDNTKKEN